MKNLLPKALWDDLVGAVVSLLALTMTLSFLFGAAAGSTDGIVNAFAATILTYVLIRALERLPWSAVRRSLAGLLEARSGPTIKDVST